MRECINISGDRAYRSTYCCLVALCLHALARKVYRRLFHPPASVYDTNPPKPPEMSLQAIKYSRGTLYILDQLKLPHESTYVPIRNCEDGFDAIKRMVVRGAPAIAIVAALALAVELTSLPTTGSSAEGRREFIFEKLDYLLRSRPTAVNLADAAGKLKKTVMGVSTTAEAVTERYLQAAERMLVDDVQDNMNIGKFGAEWILQNAAGGKDKVVVLTHCNTGFAIQLRSPRGETLGKITNTDHRRSLATAGYGTALGIIRSLHLGSNLDHAYCTETRPYNQGSRLTAYELVYEKIPATLITDSMASALMRLEGVAAVIVGADRVAANGDTANKIGTYQLAIVARYHGVKFVVAAPTTSIDVKTLSGKDIEIEQRPGREMLVIRGPRVREGVSGDEVEADLEHVETVVTAAQGIGTYNPSFDVTPNELIDAVVTEKGVVVKGPDGNFDFSQFFLT